MLIQFINQFKALTKRINQCFQQAGMVTSKGRRCSSVTHDDRYKSIISGFSFLYESGYNIKTPQGLKVKHIHCLFDEWLNKNLSSGRIQNLLSFWRFFVKAMGKNDMIKQAEHHYLRIDELMSKKKRPKIGENPDRSWSGNGVSFLDVFKMVCEHDPCVAVQLLAQAIYGLRVKESWMFKPVLADNGDTISVLAGAKGGRRRNGVKPITLDEQGKEAMTFFKNFVGNDPTNSLTPPDYSIKRWKNHYYNILKKAGVTKKGLGVTSHGLRHDYGQTLFEAIADELAQIAKKSGRLLSAQERVDLARQVISNCLGHARVNITSVYGV